MEKENQTNVNENTTKSDETVSNTNEIIGKKAFKEKLAKKNEEIEQLKQEVEKRKNDYYRAYADTQNLRNSLQKDYSNALRYRSEGFLEKLLPVIDSFNLALQTKPKDQAMLNYLTGFEYIYKNMMQALESEGVNEIKPNIGDKFDSNIMNAIDTVESDGEENRVMQVYCVAVKLHDRIIRHANVVVSKKPLPKENKENISEEKPQA